MLAYTKWQFRAQNPLYLSDCLNVIRIRSKHKPKGARAASHRQKAAADITAYFSTIYATIAIKREETNKTAREIAGCSREIPGPLSSEPSIFRPPNRRIFITRLFGLVLAGRRRILPRRLFPRLHTRSFVRVFRRRLLLIIRPLCRSRQPKADHQHKPKYKLSKRLHFNQLLFPFLVQRMGKEGKRVTANLGNHDAKHLI